MTAETAWMISCNAIWFPVTKPVHQLLTFEKQFPMQYKSNSCHIEQGLPCESPPWGSLLSHKLKILCTQPLTQASSPYCNPCPSNVTRLILVLRRNVLSLILCYSMGRSCTKGQYEPILKRYTAVC